MTEKELKKLSRLELLELLLEVSNENVELKERVAKLNTEIETAHNIEQLANSIRLVESALKYANRMAESARGLAKEETSEPTLLDREIYRRLLLLYAESPGHLKALPLELRYAVEERSKTYL